MAFSFQGLYLVGAYPANTLYHYDAGSDTMATVAAAGYFNNSDDNLNLTVDDKIWCQCADGNMNLRVSALSSGSVTCQHAGGNLPLQTPGTGTAVAKGSDLLVGQYEVGTDISTATRFVLPTPYPGAEVIVVKHDSGSEVMEFDAGGSGATGITFGTGYRRIKLQTEMDMFHVVGVSTTRWRIVGLNTNASAVAPANSVAVGGT